MGFLDELRRIARPIDDDDDGSYDDFDATEPAGHVERPHLIKEKPVSHQDPIPIYENERRSNKVVNIHTTTQLQVVLVKPDRFENAAEIADHLREKRTVVLNLETTDKEVARRLLDFLSGVAYAQEGKIKKVALSTYIITPYNVDILGDLIDELENNGFYF